MDKKTISTMKKMFDDIIVVDLINYQNTDLLACL